MLHHLKSILKIPKSALSISHIHSRNKTPISNPVIDFILDEFEHLQSVSKPVNNPTRHDEKIVEPVDSRLSSIQIPHKWPEWAELMQKLTKNGYFDGIENPFRSDGKSWNQIRTACLNFARDRPDLIRHLRSRDIQTVAGSGCPSTDRKVVNSGKRLRAHMSIDEQSVCSSCNLRGNCERAFVKPREDEGVHTVDVMRVVLTYGLHHLTGSDGLQHLTGSDGLQHLTGADGAQHLAGPDCDQHLTGSADSKPSLNQKLEEAIKSLIKDMVKFSKEKLDFDHSKQVSSIQRSKTQLQKHKPSISTTQCDWNCPKCKFLNSAGNVKCVSCNCFFNENKQGNGQLKKGDWLCIRCNFLNFAKNMRCLQCHENPPKRQLNHGEWECDSCNYINFRGNTECLKCTHKRPKSLNNST